MLVGLCPSGLQQLLTCLLHVLLDLRQGGVALRLQRLVLGLDPRARLVGCLARLVRLGQQPLGGLLSLGDDPRDRLEQEMRQQPDQNDDIDRLQAKVHQSRLIRASLHEGLANSSNTAITRQ